MNVRKLVLSLLYSFSAAAIGSAATIPNIPSWYAGLDRPPLNPPNYIFGPVWTVLYLLIAISLYLVWTHKSSRDKLTAYIFWGLQIGLNALWSLIFFGLHFYIGGVVVIVALILMVLATIVSFSRISRPAALLLVPYLAWVSFATYLTISLTALNA